MQTKKQNYARKRNYLIFTTKGMISTLNVLHSDFFTTTNEKILIKGLIRKLNNLLEEIRKTNASHPEDTDS